MEGVKALPDRVCVQSCVVVCTVRSMMEVAAVIVTAWLIDAAFAFEQRQNTGHQNMLVCLALAPFFRRNCGVHVVWLDVETFSLTCLRNSTNCSVYFRAATEYRHQNKLVV